ncbi:MAG: hypothetical protein SNG14_01375 [Rikenellaceae bacterium]
MKKLYSLLTALLIAATIVGCSEDSEELSSGTYDATYSITNLGDIPTYAHIYVTYTGDYGYTISEEEIFNFPWLYTASDVMSESITMTITFKKKSPFNLELDEGVSVDSMAPFDISMEYGVSYTDTVYGTMRSQSITEEAEIDNATDFEAYIDTLAESPLSITIVP